MGAGESDRGGGWAGDIGRGPVVLLLLAIVGLIAPRALRSSADETAKNATTSVTLKKQIDDNTPFDTRLAAMIAQASTADLSQSESLTSDGETASFHFVIASFLDPIESHLPNLFDADLMVVQRAAHQYGFTLHRHWLPWQDWIKPAPKSKRHLNEPGILLFRRTVKVDGKKRSTQLLVILVVGESPTGGVHQNALVRALHAAYANDSTRILLIGPASSGASHSLRTGIQKWHHDLLHPPPSPPSPSPVERLGAWLRGEKISEATPKSAPLPGKLEIQIVTGSATSEAALEELTFPIQDKVSVNCTYQATILPDRVIIKALQDYFTCNLGIAPEQIALLVEADTSYGQGFDSQRRGQATLESGQNPWQNALILPYPMEIGTVRNEYEKRAVLKFGPEQGNSAPKQNLEIPWTSPPDASDLPPLFSDLTPAITERRLTLMLTSLARRDIRAVGLIGTDPKDLLFLAQQVRRLSPNVQLFTVESNVIFSHPDYFKYFKGTVVASTYPLFINNQEWTRVATQRKSGQFPSGVSQGVFNAALTQIARATLTPSDDRVPLWEYRAPFTDSADSDVPPVWLTIVGQNSLAPLKVKTKDMSAHHMVDESEEKKEANGRSGKKPLAERAAEGERKNSLPRQPNNSTSTATGDDAEPPKGVLGRPPLTGIAFTVIAAVFVLVLFLILNLSQGVQSTARRWLQAPKSLSWLGLEIPSAEVSVNQVTLRPLHPPFAQCWYIVVLVLGMMLLLSIAAAVPIQSWPLDGRLYLQHLTPVVAVTALATLVLCIAVIVLVILNFFGMARGGKVAIWTLSALAVCAAAVSSYFYSKSQVPDAGQLTLQAIRVERWGDIFNGVTPIVPLATLAMAPILWAICQLRRRQFLVIHQIRQPFPSDFSSTAGLAQRVRELREPIESCCFMPTEFRDWAFLVSLIVAGWLLVDRWIPTADGPQFDRLFFVLVALACCFLYMLHVRFMAASGLLERFLRRLAQTSLADSFKDVPSTLR